MNTAVLCSMCCANAINTSNILILNNRNSGVSSNIIIPIGSDILSFSVTFLLVYFIIYSLMFLLYCFDIIDIYNGIYNA